MIPRHPRRSVLILIVAAVVLGFLFSWFARLWVDETPESRVRDTAGAIRRRIHDFTH